MNATLNLLAPEIDRAAAAYVAELPLERRITLSQMYPIYHDFGNIDIRFSVPVPASEEQALEMRLDFNEFALVSYAEAEIVPMSLLTEDGINAVANAARATLPRGPVAAMIERKL